MRLANSWVSADLQVIFITACLLATAPAIAESDGGLDATYILERVAKTYAECYTYRDSGTVRTVFISGNDKRTVEKPFHTAFVRPSSFRFEYRERKGAYEDYVYIVYRNEHETKTWWDVSGKEEVPESLNMALAGATGVSGGSAHTIPALLLPNEVTGRRLTDITTARRVENGECMGASCYRLEGKYAGDTTMVWVDIQTFLIRRIDARSDFDDFYTEQTTTYDPVIDSELDSDILEFKAPESRQLQGGAD